VRCGYTRPGMRLAILGFGLVGGSVARAVAARDPGHWHVTAWSRSDAGPRRAHAEGTVQAVATGAASAIAGADLVLLAASPLANQWLVGEVGPLLADRETTLSDVTSVQLPMAQAAAAVPGLRFVGGHPMAGRELRGYDAAVPDLFVDRPWIILPGAASKLGDVSRVTTLARACGALPFELTAEVHDRVVAAISHLPLLLSAALADTVTSTATWATAARLAAGGWRDTTRVARGDPDLGSGILELNRDEVLRWLDLFEITLGEWRASLEADGPDGAPSDGLRARLERVRSALLDAAP
jgi:prephenate dehydrogenase